MKQTRLIMVGGFLGSGKTTLLWAAARELTSRGLRVGLITNDQAPELVDTAFLTRGGVRVEEVAGSCFCCNFDGLIDAVRTLRREAEADVLIAEPVGSCTDLSATLVQPLKEHFKRELVTAPLSVLAEPFRLRALAEGRTADLHPSAVYIVRKQLEEADIVLISKADMLSSEDMAHLQDASSSLYEQAETMTISSRTGAGLDRWLDEVMTRTDAGSHIAPVDYDVYAEGEAVLGWLNATISLRNNTPDWNAFARHLIDQLARRFQENNAAVGHVKLMLAAGDTYLVANITGGEQAGERVRGQVDGTAGAQLILNARVQVSPQALDEHVKAVLANVCGDEVTAIPVAWQCLSPGRPNPTHRYDRVVSSTT